MEFVKLKTPGLLFSVARPNIFLFFLVISMLGEWYCHNRSCSVNFVHAQYHPRSQQSEAKPRTIYM